MICCTFISNHINWIRSLAAPICYKKIWLINFVTLSFRLENYYFFHFMHNTPSVKILGKKNHYYILCHKQREKVTSGPNQMHITGSSNNTQVQWNDSLRQAITYSYIQPEIKSLLRAGPPSKSQDAQGLGWSYSKYSQGWRLHNFSGPCPSIWSPL